MGDRAQSGRVPSHWNVYRPSYNTPARDEYHNSPRAYNRERSESPSLFIPETTGHDHLGPNPRIQRGTSIDHGIPRNTDHERLPKLWDDELDELIGRTVRAYDLVVHYEHDSCGGKRWSHEHIELIYELGKGLHEEQEHLKKWQRTVLRYGDQDQEMMSKIREDAEKMRAYCKKVKRTISQYESHLLPVDDDGNIYAKEGVFDMHGRPVKTRYRWDHDDIALLPTDEQEHPDTDNNNNGFDERGFPLQPRRSRWGPDLTASTSGPSSPARRDRSKSPEPEGRQGYRGREPNANARPTHRIAGRLGKHIMHY